MILIGIFLPVVGMDSVIAQDGIRPAADPPTATISSCSDDARFLDCKFPEDCRLGETVTVNCTTTKDCRVEASMRRTTTCRYCWQTESWEHKCVAVTNCSTSSSKLVKTKCKTHQSVICIGQRIFTKKVPCNWSSGVSWSRTMFLSIVCGGFGADRFYLGLWKSAIGKLFSFGGMGIWTVIDVILIAVGYVKPADGSHYMWNWSVRILTFRSHMYITYCSLLYKTFIPEKNIDNNKTPMKNALKGEESKTKIQGKIITH